MGRAGGAGVTVTDNPLDDESEQLQGLRALLPKNCTAGRPEGPRAVSQVLGPSQSHNTLKGVSRMLPEISMEPMRFAKIEAYKIFDAVEFQVARPDTIELQTQLKWSC
jgi:hypothetical protein